MKKMLLLGVIAFASLTSSAQIQGYDVGDTVDNFTVTDTDGNTHDLYAYAEAGKYILLDFFFDTCGPCQITTPIFNEFYDKFGCNAGDVICISMNNGSDSDEEVIAFEETFGGSFNHASAVSADGGAGDVAAAFNPYAYPTFTLISPDKVMINDDIWPLADVTSLEAAFPDGVLNEMPCSVNVTESSVELNLDRVYPNPTSGNVTIEFTTTTAQRAQITVINLVGEQVAVLFEGTLMAGQHREVTDLSDLASGIYMLRIDMAGQTATRKLIVE